MNANRLPPPCLCLLKGAAGSDISVLGKVAIEHLHRPLVEEETAHHSDSCFSTAEFVFPHSEDVGGIQTRLVREQRGLVRLPVLPAE